MSEFRIIGNRPESRPIRQCVRCAFRIFLLERWEWLGRPPNPAGKFRPGRLHPGRDCAISLSNRSQVSHCLKSAFFFLHFLTQARSPPSSESVSVSQSAVSSTVSVCACWCEGGGRLHSVVHTTPHNTERALQNLCTGAFVVVTARLRQSVCV